MPIALFETDQRPDEWSVSIYIDQRDRNLFEQKIKKALGADGPPIACEQLGDIDWVSKTLANLAPVRAGRFVIHGSHDIGAVKPHDLAIEINAGQAFGTGHHGTTAGCLTMLDMCLRSRRFYNCLDIGTGSGVLAIALARASNADILASDIDPVAVRVATENFRLNRVHCRIKAVVSRGLDHRIFAESGPFDLIVANILANPLQKMAISICRQLAHGGTLILSGLLPHQKSRIFAFYRMQGLYFNHCHLQDNWLTLAFEG